MSPEWCSCHGGLYSGRWTAKNTSIERELFGNSNNKAKSQLPDILSQHVELETRKMRELHAVNYRDIHRAKQGYRRFRSVRLEVTKITSATWPYWPWDRYQIKRKDMENFAACPVIPASRMDEGRKSCLQCSSRATRWWSRSLLGPSFRQRNLSLVIQIISLQVSGSLAGHSKWSHRVLSLLSLLSIYIPALPNYCLWRVQSWRCLEEERFGLRCRIGNQGRRLLLTCFLLFQDGMG